MKSNTEITSRESRALKLASSYKAERNALGLPSPDRDRTGMHKIVGSKQWALFQAPAIMSGAASAELVEAIIAALEVTP